MKRTHKWIWIVLGIMLLAAVLCACGGGKDAAPETTAAETTAETTAAESTAPETTAAPVQTSAPAAESADSADSKAPEAPAEPVTLPSFTFNSKGKEKELEALTEKAENAEKAESALIGKKEFPIEGEYTLFAYQNQGILGAAEDIELTSVLTLDKGGGGTYTFNEDSIGVKKWTLSGSDLEITLDDDSMAGGTLQNGILELDLYGDGSMYLYYAQEGADLSAYELMTVEEIQKQFAENNAEAKDPRSGTLLYDLWSTMSGSKGIHLRYNRYIDYLGSSQDYDVHFKDGVYYSCCTTTVSGLTSTMITFVDKDKKVYNLYPDRMEGNYVMDLPDILGPDGAALMDDLLKDIETRVRDEKVSKETMDLGEATYEAEIFAKDDLNPQAVFLFEQDGRLAYYLTDKDPSDDEADLQDSVFTIDVIDDQVDESLFDISGYAIR